MWLHFSAPYIYIYKIKFKVWGSSQPCNFTRLCPASLALSFTTLLHTRCAPSQNFSEHLVVGSFTSWWQACTSFSGKHRALSWLENHNFQVKESRSYLLSAEEEWVTSFLVFLQHCAPSAVTALITLHSALYLCVPSEISLWHFWGRPPSFLCLYNLILTPPKSTPTVVLCINHV